MSSLQSQIVALQKANMELLALVQRLSEFVGYDDTDDSTLEDIPAVVGFRPAAKPDKDDTLDLPKMQVEESAVSESVFIIMRHPRGRKAKWYWLTIQGVWAETPPGAAPPLHAQRFVSQTAASNYWSKSPDIKTNKKGWIVEAIRGSRTPLRLPRH